MVDDFEGRAGKLRARGAWIGRIDAPWTPSQVASLNAWQNAGYVHPFTGDCGGEMFVATSAGWVSDDGIVEGGIVQTWAHDFMADWSWVRCKGTVSPGWVACGESPEMYGYCSKECEEKAKWQK